MGNALWPATLPTPQADSSAAYGAGSNVLRTAMDAPVAKVRRRFTRSVKPFTATLKLTADQWYTLIHFYRDTLAEVLPFDWLDFVSGAGATYRFTAEPTNTYIQAGVGRWLVTVPLEVMP